MAFSEKGSSKCGEQKRCKEMKACKNCRYITYNVGDKTCPRCGSELSDKFAGMVIILDPERSEVAKIAELESVGSYAIRVK